jgi:hypothetical protein
MILHILTSTLDSYAELVRQSIDYILLDSDAVLVLMLNGVYCFNESSLRPSLQQLHHEKRLWVLKEDIDMRAISVDWFDLDFYLDYVYLANLIKKSQTVKTWSF